MKCNKEFIERIVIEVTDKTAEKWKQTPAPVKATLEDIFRKQIDEADRKMKILNFRKLLHQMGKQAEANGLTEEILQQLLNEEQGICHGYQCACQCVSHQQSVSRLAYDKALQSAMLAASAET